MVQQSSILSGISLKLQREKTQVGFYKATETFAWIPVLYEKCTQKGRFCILIAILLACDLFRQVECHNSLQVLRLVTNLGWFPYF